jgi:hypothetical protein
MRIAGRFLDRYVRTAGSSSLEPVSQALWSSSDEPTTTTTTTLLEQYKIYVEMADRVSARRGLANTFFLTLNTAIFTVIGVFWQRPPSASTWLLAFPWAALVMQCLAWFWLLRSYRQLNSAKYVVIGAMEERLPASPYWRAEWSALGEGRDPTRYWPLSHVEQSIPALFAFIYTAGFIALLLV